MLCLGQAKVGHWIEPCWGWNYIFFSFNVSPFVHPFIFSIFVVFWFLANCVFLWAITFMGHSQHLGEHTPPTHPHPCLYPALIVQVNTKHIFMDLPWINSNNIETGFNSYKDGSWKGRWVGDYVMSWWDYKNKNTHPLFCLEIIRVLQTKERPKCVLSFFVMQSVTPVSPICLQTEVGEHKEVSGQYVLSNI